MWKRKSDFIEAIIEDLLQVKKIIKQSLEYPNFANLLNYSMTLLKLFDFYKGKCIFMITSKYENQRRKLSEKIKSCKVNENTSIDAEAGLRGLQHIF